MRKRVGILVDDIVASKQLRDLIEISQSASNYKLTTLIVNDVERYSDNSFSKAQKYIRRRGILKFVSNAFFKIVCRLESIVVKRFGKQKNFFRKYDLSELGFEVINVRPNVSKDGLFFKYESLDVEKIRSAKLDLIVRGGGGILKGKILTVCPNGVISLHYADNDINRGGPPGFWEVYFRKARTGFIIQRLKEELDGGDVLYRGYIPTQWMYTLNLVRLYEISNPFFHLVLEDVTSSSPRLTVQKKVPYSAPLYTTPTPMQLLSYVSKTAIHFALKVIRKLSGRGYRWGVAYQFTNNWDDVTLWRSRKIPNPGKRFLADPFLIKRNGKHYCFVEDYNYSIKRGCISVYEITEHGSAELGVALAESFHLSYPYLFECEGDLYMCPETHEKRDIRVYRCVEFPLKWELHKILINDVSAADTNIFWHDDKWWLMTNLSTSHIDDHSSELHIFHSLSPFSDDWIPHSRNPVVFDPLKARNGGLIRDETGIYRVYQRQGFDFYGEALGVSKISKLEPNDYSETPLFEVEAQFFQGAKGAHTYNFTEGLLVFDYVVISRF